MKDMLQALEMRRDRGLDVTVILDGQEYALIPKEEVAEEVAEGVEGAVEGAELASQEERPNDQSELAPSLEELEPKEISKAVGPMKKGLRGAAEKFWKKKSKEG